MKPDKQFENIGAKPMWLLALIPLLAVVAGAWYVAKYIA